MSGPLPNPNARRRNKGTSFKALPASGRRSEPPPLPPRPEKGKQWLQATRIAWAAWWASPQATQWHPVYRAVDQLGKAGDEHLDVRLGGIYALEQIAKDDLAEGDPVDRSTVAEVLTAFVRGHAAQPAGTVSVGSAPAEPKQSPELQVRTDVQEAAMTFSPGRPRAASLAA
jgi:hypothetical protein